jgi:TolB-like protein/predicted Zn-dependent protease
LEEKTACVSFFVELKRRKVYRVAVAYVAVAWLLTEVASTVLPTFHVPEWVLQGIIILLVLGFPVAVLLAWAYQWTPEGIRLEQQSDHVSDTVSEFARCSPSSDGRTSVAVLPFQNLSPGGSDQYVADGLTELLIARLAGVPALRVISRTTSMHYRTTDKTAHQIAQELRVGHIVEGAVLRSGNRAQVVAQLIEASTDSHLWARTFEDKIGDLLDLLNEIAAAVAEEIAVGFSQEDQDRLSATQVLDTSAMEAYLHGRYYMSERSADALEQAAEYFRICITEAPEFAAGYSGLADYHTMRGLYGLAAPHETLPMARARAQEAIELDPNSGEALASIAGVQMFYDRDFKTAEENYRKAIALNPSYPITHLGYGDLLWVFGDEVSAMNEISEAIRLDPLNLWMKSMLGDFLMFGRRYEESAAVHKEILQKNSSYLPSRIRLAKALAYVGNAKEATSQLEKLRQAGQKGRDQALEAAGLVYGLLGMRDEAFEALRILEGRRRDQYVSPMPFAWGYAVMGEADRAFEWLERGIEERAGPMIFIGFYAPFDPIRNDPRFEQILTKVGIEKKWTERLPP